MRVYTSYFKNAGLLKELGVVPVGICRFPPKEFTENNLYILAPSTEIFTKLKKGEYNHAQYRSAYYAQLRNTNIAEMCKAIEKVSADNDNKDVVLCCFEMPDEFCHRHTLAQFFNDWGLFGGDVHEFTAKDQYSDCKSVELF